MPCLEIALCSRSTWPSLSLPSSNLESQLLSYSCCLILKPHQKKQKKVNLIPVCVMFARPVWFSSVLLFFRHNSSSTLLPAFSVFDKGLRARARVYVSSCVCVCVCVPCQCVCVCVCVCVPCQCVCMHITNPCHVLLSIGSLSAASGHVCYAQYSEHQCKSGSYLSSDKETDYVWSHLQQN